ncbi:beta-glucosidase [Mycolicibacterium hippocampi]|uniref:Exo-alpha-(1->6)-L-arabinopyranosidase n=1 Tax=Mycolicibacterium hippocampi TaxID=659824 RepID=A0A850PHK8_9MYCO|nr:beta-glucosidase [Mycolicibacterium hippocampi]
MCSYNRINGVYASEDHWLLTQVLRDQWGFDGVVVSDWGAVNDRVAAIEAGLDLEMPSSNGVTDAQIVEAVENGSLDEGIVDTAAHRILSLLRRALDGTGSAAGPLDADAHHALAREAAGRSIVLLKNDGHVLPLLKDTDVAVIGAFAAEPRYQGAGSSRINPTRLDNALDGIRSLAAGNITYAAGFSTAPDTGEEESVRLRHEAVEAASRAGTAVVFLGLPSGLESEGYDRDDIDLPAGQLALLDAVLDVNPNTIVVLSNGGVVALPFADRAPAILEGWLLGQAGGGAIADVLFGDVNPSGKLTETIPLRLSDTPAHLDFPGEFSRVRYGEGLFVGYRWYDARDLDVAFPFGHGLSYTTFEYGSATAVENRSGDLEVRVAVTNTGDRSGREIVQVYTARTGSRVQRPPRELKAFTTVALDPGETRAVELTVRRKDLAYWDVRVDSWIVEGGTYTVDVAASSRDIRSSVDVEVTGDDVAVPLTRQSSIGDVLAHPVGGPMLQAAMASMMADASGAAGAMAEDTDLARMVESFPIGRVAMFAAASGVDQTAIDALLAAANNP